MDMVLVRTGQSQNTGQRLCCPPAPGPCDLASLYLLLPLLPAVGLALGHPCPNSMQPSAAVPPSSSVPTPNSLDRSRIAGLVSGPAQPGEAWSGGEGFLQRCLSAGKGCGLGTSDSHSVSDIGCIGGRSECVGVGWGKWFDPVLVGGRENHLRSLRCVLGKVNGEGAMRKWSSSRLWAWRVRVRWTSDRAPAQLLPAEVFPKRSGGQTPFTPHLRHSNDWDSFHPALPGHASSRGDTPSPGGYQGQESGSDGGLREPKGST